MKEIVERFREYVTAYSHEIEHFNFKDETFINHMLYGIWIVLDEERFRFSKEFCEFKKKLMEEWRK